MSEFEAYLRLGFAHITDPAGYDHILFVVALCAVYELKNWKKVLVLVTAFTIGHSITLALSTLNFVVVRSNLVEFLIPITILVTAVGNFFYRSPVTILDKERPSYLRYIFALLFGLIHGLGFSTYLKSLLGGSTNVVAQLFAFNVGLELGQILIVLCVLTLALVVINIFQVRKHDWNLAVSGIVAGMAISLVIKNNIFF